MVQIVERTQLTNTCHYFSDYIIQIIFGHFVAVYVLCASIFINITSFFGPYDIYKNKLSESGDYVHFIRSVTGQVP